MSTFPTEFAKLILPFAFLFSKRVFESVQVLLADAILAPGKRTATSVLRIMGLSQERHFQNYHRVLNRAVWSSLAASRILLQLLVCAFAPEGPLIFALNDTIERRWGSHITARGIYRDPVLCPSQRYHDSQGRRHKKLTDWAASDAQAGPPLVAESENCHRRRQRLCSARFSGCCQAACHSHHPFAPGCRAVCASAPAPAWPARAHASQRRAAARIEESA